MIEEEVIRRFDTLIKASRPDQAPSQSCSTPSRSPSSRIMRVQRLPHKIFEASAHPGPPCHAPESNGWLTASAEHDECDDDGYTSEYECGQRNEVRVAEEGIERDYDPHWFEVCLVNSYAIDCELITF